MIGNNLQKERLVVCREVVVVEFDLEFVLLSGPDVVYERHKSSGRYPFQPPLEPYLFSTVSFLLSVQLAVCGASRRGRSFERVARFFFFERQMKRRKLWPVGSDEGEKFISIPAAV